MAIIFQRITCTKQFYLKLQCKLATTIQKADCMFLVVIVCLFSFIEMSNFEPFGHCCFPGLLTKDFIGIAMNVDNENIEPVTDLGLALSYSNQCVQRRSNKDSGAGANAGSRIDMTFVANDPLSELVWSPHKGLSLKFTDSRFVDTKTLLFWGAGPSNVALSPPQSNTDRRSATEKPMDEENFLTPVTSFHLKNEVTCKDTCKDTSTKSPKSDSGVMQLRGLTHEHEKGEDTCHPDVLSCRGSMELSRS